MEVDELLRDRDPKPGARRIAGRRRAKETLPEAADLVLGNPDALVDDLDPQLGVDLAGPDQDRPALGGVLDRVRNQVRRRLLEALAVEVPDEPRGRFDDEGNPALLGELIEILSRELERCRDVDRAGVKRELSRLDA